MKKKKGPDYGKEMVRTYVRWPGHQSFHLECLQTCTHHHHTRTQTHTHATERGLKPEKLIHFHANIVHDVQSMCQKSPLNNNNNWNADENSTHPNSEQTPNLLKRNSNAFDSIEICSLRRGNYAKCAHTLSSKKYTWNTNSTHTHTCIYTNIMIDNGVHAINGRKEAKKKQNAEMM